MTQWNKQRCGGEPLGGKRSGACCCSYCEGYQDALGERDRGIRGAIEDVSAFLEALGGDPNQDVGDNPPALTRRVIRWRLLKEEVDELNAALIDNDVVEVADAYADIIYIALNCAITQIGKERFARVWDEVHRSNMAKRGPSGTIVYREDGKVLKPPGWKPPDIKRAFAGENDAAKKLLTDEEGGAQ